ncbi:MAG: hypothetical protein O3B13_20405 [Planctomycetota bacterium]|nr:hypothetical protein [Planctomycetota bacterium]MDA1165466.1 hypothetical protein [Planctomycetota bacterium]
MKQLVAILSALFLLVVAAFCVFGFMATFEPTDRTTEFIAFRVAYGVIGVSCLLGAGLLIASNFRSRNGS